MSEDMSTEEKINTRAIANYALRMGMADMARAAKSFASSGKVNQDQYLADAKIQLLSEIGT